MIDVALALDALVPSARYRGSLTEHSEAAYNAIQWLDDRPKPSWSDIEAVEIGEADWQGFRRWRYTNAEYLGLLRSHPGLANALESAIASGDYVAAQSLWNELGKSGAITSELGDALAKAVIDYNLPDEIKLI